MDMIALRLSRIQFAFTIIFHIIFPSFTIGLAAWFTVLEALGLATGRPVYRGMFEFWLKIFGVAFGLGVVSGRRHGRLPADAALHGHQLQHFHGQGRANGRTPLNFTRRCCSIRQSGLLRLLQH
jgi:Cytochrome bd terminal oxidase subunit I